MKRRILFGTLLAGVLALPPRAVAQQPAPTKTMTATVVMTTSASRRTVAVLSKGEPAFLFCIDLAAPVPQKIEFTGPARVLYRPLPLDIPAGFKVSGPENVSNAVAVLPTAGKGWVFLGKGEKTVLPAGDPAGAGATVFPASGVRRIDWVGENGQRRGMDVEPCFEAAG
jgi:hypothetical protein